MRVAALEFCVFTPSSPMQRVQWWCCHSAIERHRAIANCPDRDAGRGKQPDIASSIGKDGILLPALEPGHGLDEVIPVAGPVEVIDRLPTGIVRFRQRGAEADKFAVLG